MDLEVGIAGWVLSGEILREKSLTLLAFPEVCAAHGVETVWIPIGLAPVQIR